MSAERRIALRVAPRRLTAAAGGALLLLGLLTGCAPSDPAPPAAEQGASSAEGDSSQESSIASLPEGFSHLREVDPDIRIELRYATEENFTGRVVDGYGPTDAAILRDEAAAALSEVRQDLAADGLGLLVWDAFRPTRAVDDFVRWSRTDDDETKADYYPDHEKAELFELGYIAEHSKHSLGGTVDLTLVREPGGEPLDMGGSFDYFGDRSHYDAEGLTEEQRENRALLHDAMERRGFEPYPLEWWHFTYPLPEETEAADFPVE